MTTGPAALIATAKALAPHTVAWVAENEPLDHLVGNRTWAEAWATVAVLAEVVGNCEDGARVLAEVCAATDTPGPVNRGHGAKWSRPDDGVVDDVAVERVAAGGSTPAVPVPLSPPERLRAAALITKQGGGPSVVAKLLHVSAMTAYDLLGDLAAAGQDGMETGEARAAAKRGAAA